MSASILVKEIAQEIKGTVEGNAELRVKGGASLTDASEEHVSFFSNPKYVDQLQRTSAGAILIPAQAKDLPLPAGKTLIRVTNPTLAFAQTLEIFERSVARHPKTGIHPQAIISPKAKIGANVSIGPFAIVEDDAEIGANTILYAHVYVGARVKIGENCLFYPHVVFREEVQIGNRVSIQPHTVIGCEGYGYTFAMGKHYKIPQVGTVVIEDDVEIGSHTAIARATTGVTRIGAGTKIDNNVQVGHNVTLGKHCLIVAQVGISGSTNLGNYVTLAGQVGIADHVNIGDGAIITAQSGVMSDVEPKAILFGSPARPHREAMKLQAIFGKLPEIYETIKNLKKKFTS